MYSPKSEPLKSFYLEIDPKGLPEHEIDQQIFTNYFERLSKEMEHAYSVKLKSKTFLAKKDSTRTWFKSTLYNLLYPNQEGDPFEVVKAPMVFADIIYAINDKEDAQELMRVFYTPADTKHSLLTSDFFDVSEESPIQVKLLSENYRVQLLSEILRLLDDQSVINTLRMLGRFGQESNSYSEYDDVPFSGRTF